MAANLVKSEGFAVDASVMEANASRYHGFAPDELDWTDNQRQKSAVSEYLTALETETMMQETTQMRKEDEARGGRRHDTANTSASRPK